MVSGASFRQQVTVAVGIKKAVNRWWARAGGLCVRGSRIPIWGADLLLSDRVPGLGIFAGAHASERIYQQ